MADDTNRVTERLDAGFGPGQEVTIVLATRGEEDLDEDATEKKRSRERVKETGARTIAIGLMGTFGVSILSVLIWVGIILSGAKSPADAETFAKTVVPLLDALTKFAAQVFSPLLAFVLSYYFGRRKGT